MKKVTENAQIFDVIVVGGGVVGLTMALALAQRGSSVAVIDSGQLQAATKTPDARVFALNHASQQLLSSLQIWPLLRHDRLSPYEHMTIWDAAQGAQIEFDCRMIAAEYLGLIVEESILREALLKGLAQLEQVILFPEQSIEKVQQKAESIVLASRSMQWTARQLFAADGANSHCRDLLKVPMTTWSYHHHAVVARVTTELAHQKTAYQVFNPDGPLAFLPLSAPHECSIVWSTTPAEAKKLAAMSETQFNQALTRAFQSRLGKVKASSERHQFPLTMRHVEHYVGDHWVLLGDAAHTIHPLAGLGLNLGLADVADYLQLLDKNQRQAVTKTQLLGYQRQRKYEVWQMIILMQSLKGIFSSTLPAIRLLRGLGLQCFNQLPLLKRLCIGIARG